MLGTKCSHGALVPRRVTCYAEVGRGDTADRKLGTAWARYEALAAPKLSGSYKAAPLTTTCFFQAFTHPGQCQRNKVQGKLGNPCLARTTLPLPPSYTPRASSLHSHSHTGSGAQSSHVSEGPIPPAHTVVICSPHTPESSTASSNLPGTRHGNTDPAGSSNRPSHLAAKIISIAERV